MNELKIKKRNGQTESFSADKINRVLQWGIEGIKDVSFEDIAMNAHLSFFDGMSTKDIHKSLVESAANLISEQKPNYQWVASKLLNYSLRKDVWGGKNPPKFYNFIKENIEINKIYDPEIFKWYSKKEIDKLDEIIHHERDFNFSYAGIKQLCDKYLIQNRHTKQIFETPQFAYVLVAMVLFRDYGDKRIEYIKRAYNYFSKHKINLPTPIMAGVRSLMRSYASCALFSIDDNLNSIFANNSAIGLATASRYGIGINASRLRATNAPIRNGEVLHTGPIPFLKMLESTVKSCHQNGLRGGGATVCFNWFHHDILDILVLKNNGGTEDNRVRKLDYSISLDKLFYERFLEDKDVTLFSYHECPELWNNFGLENFRELYEKAEKNTKIKFKKVVKARELMILLSKERIETGRIYIMNIDHANNHGQWKEQVDTHNLCVAPETFILTKSGYYQISLLENKEVEIWNGNEWSKTLIKKTGENQSLLKVILSDGSELYCTPYHKWYTVGYYEEAKRGKFFTKTTLELEEGDKLIKFESPIVDGTEDVLYPYTHGAFCADGFTYQGENRIWLYGEKIKLVEYLECRGKLGNYNEKSDRIGAFLPLDLAPKFFVPFNASIKNKISWLEGFLDMEGCVVNVQSENGINQSLQAASIHKDFLFRIKLLLHLLGIHSKVVDGLEAGERLMPDGHGGMKPYFCQKSYRILISSIGLLRLMNLGFSPKRLKIVHRKPQRNASQFVKVVKILDEGRISDTYCCNESLRHRVIFNSILTGNCVEIEHPLIPINDINDKDGEIGVCILSAINLLEIKDEDELRLVCDVIVRMLDSLIEYQNYFVPAAENFAKKRRSLGVGVTNLAAFLAREGLNYESKKAPNLTAKWMEKISYYLIDASCELAKEKGPCEKFNLTKYADGILPIDTYKKEIDSFVTEPLHCKWDKLREKIKQYGLRNSTLLACMPCESTSVIQSSTNGIEPPRSIISFKKSKHGVIPVIIPGIDKWKDNYTFAFDMESNEGYLRVCAAIQKFCDMSMSCNLYYSVNKYSDKQIPQDELIRDILTAYKYGLKSLYYSNTSDNDIHFAEDKKVEGNACESGACSI